MIYLRNSDLKTANGEAIAFAQIYEYDKSQDNINFTEYVIKEVEDRYLIIGWANSIEQFKNKSDSYTDSGYVYVEIHKGTHPVYDFKKKENVERSQDQVEKIICKAIDEQIIKVDTIYSGYLQLGVNRFGGNYLDGLITDPQMIAMAVSYTLGAEGVAEPILINTSVDLSQLDSKGNNKGSNSKFSPVREYDKLLDRERFLVEQINALGLLANPCLTLAEYSQQYNSSAIDDKTAELINNHVKLVMGLMR